MVKRVFILKFNRAFGTLKAHFVQSVLHAFMESSLYKALRTRRTRVSVVLKPIDARLAEVNPTVSAPLRIPDTTLTQFTNEFRSYGVGTAFWLQDNNQFAFVAWN